MSHWLLWPALALTAGVVALVPLGRAVLDRGVVFIDLAVAQAAAAAALWAMGWFGHDAGWLSDLAGLCGALLCAATVATLSRHWPQQREALIGLLYVLAACLALLGARQDAHGRERLLELLAADVLWAREPAVLLLTLVASSLVLLLRLRPALLEKDTAFYALFATVVSVAVPLLGLFVVFALLIAPALWMRGTGARRGGLKGWLGGWLGGCLIGWAGCAAGLGLSWFVDLPSGPCVALSVSALGLAAMLMKPASPPSAN
jgi:zinc/manganese transport system permease protein